MEDYVFLMLKPGFIHLSNQLETYLNSEVILSYLFQMDRDMAERFYYEHNEKSFYKELIEYMISDQSRIIIIKGDIANIRKLIGATDPKEAAEHTFRHKYGYNKTKNAVHCSDSTSSALREITFLKQILNQLFK